jgi:uncharacterized membrane protein YccC
MASKTDSLSVTPVQPSGLQFAVRILIGCVIVWFVLDRTNHHNPLWAVISIIVATEPELSAALMAFNSRIVNTFIGCAVGLAILYLLGPSFGSILLGIVASVLICTHLIRVPGSWRIAPVTVAIVMTPSVLGGSRAVGLAAAIERTEEVLLGSGVALLITLVSFALQRQIARKSSSGSSSQGE